MVVDTSIILAVYFNEPSAPWAASQLNANAGNLRMSTVNLAEALIRIRDRQPTLADQLEQQIVGSNIRFIAPDQVQAQIAAKARLEFSVNLGDCFAYALARVENCPILTLDHDFARVDVPVVMP